MAELILGSKSAQRREIMAYFNYPFKQANPSFDEESIPFNGNPVDYVFELAEGKAESLFPRYPNDLILTADTIVYREGKLYAKPKDEQDALRILSELQGHWHKVITGVSLRQGDQKFHEYEETKVLFNPLTEKQIRTYHTKLPWEDKCGGYDIVGGPGLIVRRIEGCYFNVLGLPLNSLRQLLLKFGIDLWNYIR